MRTWRKQELFEPPKSISSCTLQWKAWHLLASDAFDVWKLQSEKEAPDPKLPFYFSTEMDIQTNGPCLWERRAPLLTDSISSPNTLIRLADVKKCSDIFWANGCRQIYEELISNKTCVFPTRFQCLLWPKFTPACFTFRLFLNSYRHFLLIPRLQGWYFQCQSKDCN